MKVLLLDIELKQVPDWPKLYASREGEIFRQKTNELVPVRTWQDSHGYLTCKVCRNKNVRVHRLVAAAWVPNPSKLTDVNHLDGNKHHNAVSNLEWCSRRDNLYHALRLGLHDKTERAVVGVNLHTGHGLYARSASYLKRLGFVQANVWKCLNGERRSAGGYKWEYL